MTAPANSLISYLEYLTTNNIDDDAIYAHLVGVNQVRLLKLVKRLILIEGLAAPRSRTVRAVFEGKRSRLKGVVYEKIVHTLLSGIKCFESYTNLATTTNELDVLVILGPSSAFVPAMREWGTHCICECKYHSGHVSTDWVTKLNTVLQTHGAHVGLLITKKGVAERGAAARVRHQLQMIAAITPSRFLLCLSWDDLVACANGDNFLRLISRRYVELRSGVHRLSLTLP